MPMSMLKINIKPLGRSDLVKIWQYTYQEWGAVQADHYLRELEIVFTNLSSSPLLGRAIDEILHGMRLHPHNHHVIIYKVNDTTIEIIRVLHKRMDISQHKIL